MKLRTRLDLFSTALLSALGAAQVVACGGTALSGASDGGAGPAGAGGGTAGASQGGSGGGAVNRFPCNNPRDLGGGLIQCDGFPHRETSGTCATKLPRSDQHLAISPTAECKTDADCTAKPYGLCQAAGGPQGVGGSSGPSVPVGPVCGYGCAQDRDCAANELCQCGDPVGFCTPAHCKADADCNPGFLCAGHVTRGCDGITTYTCQSPTPPGLGGDDCGSDADCTVAGNHCFFDPQSQSVACAQNFCINGRPFLVEGRARLARHAARADWRALSLFPRVEQLDAALCAELAEEWTRFALMEHASIAAFARFSLQLMSLGAPPELIERATSAMADETKHAKACFAVASSYAAVPVGPGPLAIEHSLEGTSLEEIVVNTIREGCVAETVAAIEAREAAEHVEDLALKQLLLVISEDETKHAELAFVFVQWALAVGGASLASVVREEFAQLAAGATRKATHSGPSDDRLLCHGVVSSSLRRAIRTQAFESVILPCAKALHADPCRVGPNARLAGRRAAEFALDDASRLD